MFDNRKRVLEMLDARRITVDEAMKLLEAMEAPGRPAGETKRETFRIKYLRVLVDTPQGHNGEGAERVNVRVPVSLIRAGMKFTSLIPDAAGDKVEAAMKEKGINLDLKHLKDADIEELIQGLAELEVDISENGGHGKVKIFAE
jgi:hypothetical protein